MTEAQKTEIIDKIVKLRTVKISDDTDDRIFMRNFIENGTDGAYTVINFLLNKIDSLESDKEKIRDLAIKIYEL